MTQSTGKISPLRQRMIDDMRMRHFSPATQRNYIRYVRDFAAYLKRSPDQASAEELRQYLLHLTTSYPPLWAVRQRPSAGTPDQSTHAA
jgi:hypothetical protein